MIVRVAPSETMTRRSAFTLMEVLVVVAIVVILASVGTIATLTFLKGAKEDAAKQQMMNLVVAEKAWSVKNSGNQLPDGDLSPLQDFLEPGALISAFQTPFTHRYEFIQTSTGGTNRRCIFSCTNPDKGGEVLSYPN